MSYRQDIPTNSSDGPIPRTVRQAISYIVWCVLIVEFGREGVSALAHGEWVPAVVSFIGLALTATLALNWSKMAPWLAKKVRRLGEMLDQSVL